MCSKLQDKRDNDDEKLEIGIFLNEVTFRIQQR